MVFNLFDFVWLSRAYATSAEVVAQADLLGAVGSQKTFPLETTRDLRFKADSGTLLHYSVFIGDEHVGVGREEDGAAIHEEDQRHPPILEYRVAVGILTFLFIYSSSKE